MSKKIKDADGITEFVMLDPDRVDAVSSPANGIGFLMLKSIDPGRAPAPATRPHKERTMKAEKKATLAAAKSAAEGGVLAKGSARALVFDVLEHLEKKAAAALAAGDMPTYRDVKRELLTMKWEQRELATERTPAAFTKRAMFGTPLFGPKVRTHTLPDVDRDVDYR